jgi:hypothetical protein
MAMDAWQASVRSSAAASEREINSWKKARASAVAAAYDQLLALAAADLAAAEHVADSEYDCSRLSRMQLALKNATGTGRASARMHVHSCSS